MVIAFCDRFRDLAARSAAKPMRVMDAEPTVIGDQIDSYMVDFAFMSLRRFLTRPAVSVRLRFILG